MSCVEVCQIDVRSKICVSDCQSYPASHSFSKVGLNKRVIEIGILFYFRRALVCSFIKNISVTIRSVVIVY